MSKVIIKFTEDTMTVLDTTEILTKYKDCTKIQQIIEFLTDWSKLMLFQDIYHFWTGCYINIYGNWLYQALLSDYRLSVHQIHLTRCKDGYFNVSLIGKRGSVVSTVTYKTNWSTFTDTLTCTDIRSIQTVDAYLKDQPVLAKDIWTNSKYDLWSRSPIDIRPRRSMSDNFDLWLAHVKREN